MDDERVLVWVYGTLRRNGALHDHMTHIKAEWVSDERLPGKLFEAGYPVFVYDDEAVSSVLGEVYSIPTVDLAYLDHIEGVHHGMYTRHQTTLDVGEVHYYTNLRKLSHAIHVASGNYFDWVGSYLVEG